ncbi:MAG: NifU family protein [Chlamydia sp.]
MKNRPQLFPWKDYSRKFSLRIETPYCIGLFSVEEAEARSMHLAKSSVGSMDRGNFLILSWLIDIHDGMILDARFQAFGDTALIGGAEVSCELVVGKNYDQASRITADHIEAYVRDKNGRPAFPKSSWPHINLVIEAIGDASLQCSGLPLSEQYVAPPLFSSDIAVNEGGWPQWLEMSKKERLAVVEHVISQDIRPYIELDAGGIDVIDITDDHQISIKYQGSCTTCYSATGATLSYIQQVFTAKIWPEIRVIPHL